MKFITSILCALLITGCGSRGSAPEQSATAVPEPHVEAIAPLPAKTAKTVHVFVALCDNSSQGIVPVPATLGNGDDPDNNLYWGAMYGTRSFLKRSRAWSYLGKEESPGDDIIERIVFRHADKNVYLVADAYRGSAIKTTLIDFLRSAGGNDQKIIRTDKQILGLNGNADLLVYVGHNGLMDVNVPTQSRSTPDSESSAMVLACKSEPYFRERLTALGSKSLLLTTGFMAPEAYTLDAAVCAWVSGSSNQTIRERAAAAYHKYQKCGMRGARRLFYSDK